MIVLKLSPDRSRLLEEAEKWMEIARATSFGVLHDEAAQKAEACLRKARELEERNRS